MQIQPTTWQNPAAHAQQSTSQTRSPQSAATASPSGALSALEQSAKTADRDANERYDGPTSDGQKQQDQETPSMSPQTLLDLPADDGQEGTLDLRG